MKRAGAVIELDVARFSSPHTPVSFQHHYVSSHQRKLLPKKSVFGFWLANHSLLCTTLDDCLHSSGIEFSHPGMKSSLLWGTHSERSGLLSKWAFVHRCCERPRQKEALRKSHQNDSPLYSSHMPRNHDLPKSSCSLLRTCVRVVYPERNCSAADRSMKEFQ